MKQDLWPIIIERIQKGNTNEFQFIVETYKTPLFIWVTNFMGNSLLIEDMVQEIFLSAYSSLHSFDETKASFKTWLFTIAKNKCLNEIRKKKQERVQNISNIRATHDVGKAFLEKEIEQQLDAALQTLPNRNKTVFILAEFLGFTHIEISQIEKIKIGTVKSRLSRAKEKLRYILNQYWEEYNG